MSRRPLPERAEVKRCCGRPAVIVDTRIVHGAVRRRRECPTCKRRWSSLELVSQSLNAACLIPVTAGEAAFLEALRAALRAGGLTIGPPRRKLRRGLASAVETAFFDILDQHKDGGAKP